MSSAVRGSSRVAVLCVLGFTALIVACGGGATSDGCDQSSKEKPLSNLDVASCKNWDLKFGTATLVPNDVILQANMFNDVSDFKSWIVVEANLKYKGSGTGRVSDAISSRAILVGSKNLLYVANDETPTFSELKDEFAPVPFDAPSPYSGGTVTISMWFWVDNDDSDFVLGLFVDDKEADEPNLWIDVSDEPEDEFIEAPEAAVESVPCDPYFRYVDGNLVGNTDLSNCDFSYQDLSDFPFGGRNLTGTNFVGANLTVADFEGANLTSANLGGAILAGAFLTLANLTDANLEGADLSGAFLGDVVLYRANLTNARLSAAIFNRDNVNCLSSTGSNTCDWGPEVVGADLTQANLSAADLSSVDLTGANLTGANLTGANLTGANLTGANLYLANVDGAIFSGAIFAGTTMPDGTVKN